MAAQQQTMMKRFTYLLFLLTGLISTSQAQNLTGTIKGTITTNDGQPAPYVTIQIKDKNRGTVTDEKGGYTFRRLQPGQYVLLVSLVGFESSERSVTVEAGKTADVDIQLQLSDTQLKEVTILGNQNKFGKKESGYIARLPISNLENPQVYNTVSKELMKEQVITTFDDALRNAPGVNRLWSSTGRPNDGAGFFSMRGFSVQPTMINGIAGVTNGSIDPANIERIETIKGPSGTLFGNSLISFGGLINIVTKKPYETFGGEITYTGGGFGLNRITADVNAPLNQEKTALLRVNSAYHYEKSFQDFGFKKSFYVAPSFTYKASDRLTFDVNAEFYNGEGTNALMVFLNRTRQLFARTPEELGIDFNRSFTNNDITYKTPTVNLFGQMSYKLSDKWTSQTNISRSNRKSDGYYSYVMFLDGNGQPNDSLLSRFVYKQNSTSITTDIQQNFIGDFHIGGLRNRVVVGLDYLSMETVNNNSPYLLFDYVNAVDPKDLNYSKLNKEAVDAKLSQLTTTPTRNRVLVNTYSAYISDVLNITDALSAMLSLRVDYFDTKGTKDYIKDTTLGRYTQTAVSPKFGLVYQVVKDKVSVFANYMNGFSNTPPMSTPPPGMDATLKPRHANQIEGGVKLDFLNHRLNFTASYYDLTVNNMSRATTIEIDGQKYNYTIQDGTQVSRGFEADLTASPVNGLNIVAGYSYNDSKTKASKTDNGLRPTTAGPSHLANLWVSYTATGGKLQGLGAGFGGNYASENLITNSVAAGSFTLPSYTILNASVFYNMKACRLAVKVDNIANKEYFGGWTTVEKQMPRRLSVSAGFKF
jgi:iron complex outermembrane receptor protein